MLVKKQQKRSSSDELEKQIIFLENLNDDETISYQVT